MAARTNPSTTLCLIQCGDTDWDREGRILGATDLPMSAPGRALVTDACAKQLPQRLSIVCHGSDEAATETAELVARATAARTRRESDLHDPDLGVLEGLSRTDFAERYYSRFRQWNDDPLNLSPPDGEPMIEARSRLLRAIGKVSKRHRGHEIGVVLHVVGLALVRAWLAGAGPRDIWKHAANRPMVERYPLHETVIEQLLNDDALLPAGA